MFHPGLNKWFLGALLALAAAYVVWGLILHVTWLAGWLPGVIAVGVLVTIRTRVGAVLAGLVVVVVLFFNMAWINSVLAAEEDESGVTRMAAWETNWLITREHLLFGTGPAGYAAYYMTYYPQSGMATHSNYIDILAETGLTGFAIYAWLIGSILWTGVKVNWRLRHQTGFLRAMACAGLAGAIACTVMMGFGDWLIPFAYTQTIMGFDYAIYNWIFMGTLIVVDRLTQPTPAPAASTELTPAG
jgi:O-antigen ligase